MTFDDETCFDCLTSQQRKALYYIIQRDEPLTAHEIMIGGMNPNNVKSKYREEQYATYGA